MPIGIKDVAKMANVSIATVSRVINKVPNVNPEIRERVEIAVKNLNYEPNRMAQSLSGTPLKAIAVAASRSSNSEYTSRVLMNISKYMQKAGYHVILNHADNDIEEVEQCTSLVKSSMVQGVILLGSKCEDLLVTRLYELGIPFVVIGRVSNPILSDVVFQVDTNNIEGSNRSIEYLFSLGHRNIGCIHSALSYVVSRDRLDGYLLAHKNANVPINYRNIVDGGYTVGDAYEAALELLSQENPPTAIFSTDDTKALGCYKAAAELNLKIPEDLSIIGYNNYEFLSAVTPSLTTTDVPVGKLGIQAAEILCNIIEKKEGAAKVFLPTKFIIRNSCTQNNVITK